MALKAPNRKNKNDKNPAWTVNGYRAAPTLAKYRNDEIALTWDMADSDDLRHVILARGLNGYEEESARNLVLTLGGVAFSAGNALGQWAPAGGFTTVRNRATADVLAHAARRVALELWMGRNKPGAYGHEAVERLTWYGIAEAAGLDRRDLADIRKMGSRLAYGQAEFPHLTQAPDTASLVQIGYHGCRILAGRKLWSHHLGERFAQFPDHARTGFENVDNLAAYLRPVWPRIGETVGSVEHWHRLWGTEPAGWECGIWRERVRAARPDWSALGWAVPA